MSTWLVKSEPESYSIDHFAKDRTSDWTGVRNYQARNYLREMKPGDQVLYYHSSGNPSGVVGLAEVKSAAQPDKTQFDKRSEFYDPKATKDAPRWFCPTLEFVRKFSRPIPLSELKSDGGFGGMPLLERGSRLSVQPVSGDHFRKILSLEKEKR